MRFETVIGLEIHIELQTKTKIFCGCKTDFGGRPNTQICEVCTGMPGTLPRVNNEVIRLALKTGLALNCHINYKNVFDRKNYFYPDLPKSYQISQLYLPICFGGGLYLESSKRNIRIKEIHMEEDAGKLIHENNQTYIDFNRCGIPLLEVVTEADFRNKEEVIEFVSSLRDILRFIDVSNCKMEEGSLRVDVNLSVRRLGDSKLGVRTEMKNLSSLKSIGRAIDFEEKRQINEVALGNNIIQETRRFDEALGETYSMRKKVNYNDYRYFPDPDIKPIYISDDIISQIKREIPELPYEKRKRYTYEYEIPQYDIGILTSSKKLSYLFEETVRVSNSPKEVSNFILGDVLRIVNERGENLEDIKINPKSLGETINLVLNNIITRSSAKAIVEELYLKDFNIKDYIEANDLINNNDLKRIEDAVEKIIKEYDALVSEYKNGSKKILQFLMGMTMKELGGRTSPKEVLEVLNSYLK